MFDTLGRLKALWRGQARGFCPPYSGEVLQPLGSGLFPSRGGRNCRPESGRLETRQGMLIDKSCLALQKDGAVKALYYSCSGKTSQHQGLREKFRMRWKSDNPHQALQLTGNTGG